MFFIIHYLNVGGNYALLIDFIIFVFMVTRRELDPVWWKLSKKVKQLVEDLTTLRKLFK